MGNSLHQEDTLLPLKPPYFTGDPMCLVTHGCMEGLIPSRMQSALGEARLKLRDGSRLEPDSGEADLAARPTSTPLCSEAGHWKLSTQKTWGLAGFRLGSKGCFKRSLMAGALFNFSHFGIDKVMQCVASGLIEGLQELGHARANYDPNHTIRGLAS